MAKVTWTEPAIENLNDIAEYIAISNEAAARKLVNNIYTKVARLENFPESGRIPNEIPEFGYREVVINPCRVFYKIEQDNVYILHVLRQERDLRKYIISEIEN